MLKLHVDVAADDFAMRLAGTSRPFVGAGGVLISGAAAVARQATAPPQTRQVGCALAAACGSGCVWWAGKHPEER